MAASAGDYRPLLGAGLWLAGSAALLAGLYGVTRDSYVALALAFQYLLIAAAVWAVRGLQHQRDLAARHERAPADDVLSDQAAATAKG
jgi:hypothetical protein